MGIKMKQIKGSGFLRVLFKMNVLPIILLTIVITTFSAMRFAASMRIETKNGLVDLSHTVATLYDKVYEGDYHAVEKDGEVLLWKGEHLLNGDFAMPSKKGRALISQFFAGIPVSLPRSEPAAERG